MKLVFRCACTMLLILSGMALAQDTGGDKPVLPPTLDEQLVELAEQVPGFGGMYQDPETGRVIVHLKDLGRIATARQGVGAFLTGVSPVPLAGTKLAPPAVLSTDAKLPEMTFVKASTTSATWRGGAGRSRKRALTY